MASSPLLVRMRAKLLKAREGKRATDASAGRYRKNKKAAERLYLKFQETVEERRKGGQNPHYAALCAANDVKQFFNLNGRVKDEKEVLRIFFNELLSSRLRP